MPAGVKEDQCSEEGSATPLKQEPNMQEKEEALPAKEAPDTPDSQMSTVASSNGGTNHTEAEHEDSSATPITKSSSSESELNPMSTSSSPDEALQPQESLPVDTESEKTPTALDTEEVLITKAQTEGEHHSFCTTSATTTTTTTTSATILPPPLSKDPTDIPAEGPWGIQTPYGINESFRDAFSNHNMSHTINFRSGQTLWPARNYLLENSYTLPLPRDRATLAMLPDGRAPNAGEQCSGEARQDQPADSHCMMGALQLIRTSLDFARDPSAARAGYDEHLDVLQSTYLQDIYRAHTLMAPKRASMVSLDGVRRDARWRDPNLREVICMLSHPMDPVKSNAAAYLQHLCYENDHVKEEVRQLRGIPVLVGLLEHPKAEVHRKVCGALRNISYGRDHLNKVAIRNCDGIPALIRLLKRSRDVEVRELVTGWSAEQSDPSKPRDVDWTTVFKNTSGCLRNVSSDGAEARQRLRETEGLLEALIHTLQTAVARRDLNNKCVENCICILRNLSYHIHKEVPSTERVKNQPASKTTKSAYHKNKRDESVWFGERTAKAADEWFSQYKQHGMSDKKYNTLDVPKRTVPMKGLEVLYQPEVVRLYLSLLKLSQNQNTLEAAAGALQNLSAGHWAWSSYIRMSVRKEKGLPMLVELLQSDADNVIRAVAIALRNLAIDRRNKDLIGSYAMRDLVGSLPCGQQHPARNLEGETVIAMLNTIHEIITDNVENARFLLQGEGIQKLVALNKTSQSVRETKAASHILQTVWAYKDLRNMLTKAGWNKSHFKPAVSGARKKVKNGKAGYDDITLPLMEKNQDGYYTADQTDKLPEAPCHTREHEQNASAKRHFIRNSRPAIGLVEHTPQPLDSWV
ncbi:armadillo repeat protein deleted in velo-cardio-facial syndrome isoform X3 [Denticeps clupeoides]|uniref:armadillo repeat protein deleted in velo-cardio-facial syndrome isoform X3 n=1 Tax=Denticeps clupeoides TaxID=299321 RepID=UPI0010A3F5FE|nr:armadillo repeat protein deleted in velo-cardio-facial syndrome-like isoform X3 [Denticeps clupeoides]